MDLADGHVVALQKLLELKDIGDSILHSNLFSDFMIVSCQITSSNE